MARALNIIQQQIIDRLAIDAIVVSNNKFSRRRIWSYVVAFCIQVMELIVDTGKVEIDDTIANKNPHTITYIENLVKAFQYGYDLVPEQDYYDNTGLTQSQIDDSKIIATCSVKRTGRILSIKVAKANGNSLQPLSDTEVLALQAYLKKVIDAGVFYAIINLPADSLKFNCDIYYNPMLIDGNGISIIDGSEVVKNTLYNYLKNLQFNGKYSLQSQQDVLQAIDGVIDVKLNAIYVKADVSDTYEIVSAFYFPASGYLAILDETTDLNINYIPYYAS